jgi:hypothetical protein
VVSSEVDYNLVIDKTLINSTEKGGTVYITAKRTDSTTTTILNQNTQSDDAWVKL